MAPVQKYSPDCERCGAQHARRRHVRHPDYRGANFTLTICDRCAEAIDLRVADAWRWLRVRAIEVGNRPS